MSKGAATATTELDPQLKERYLEAYSGIKSAADIPFTPYTGDLVSGFNPDQLDTFAATRGMFGDSMGYNPRGELAGMATGPLDISQYQNPYQEQVIDAAINDLDRARQIQQTQAQDRAIRSGAFGGSRSGILESEADRAYFDAVGRTAANLRASGFDTAAGLGMQDRGFRSALQGGLLDDQYRTLGLLGGIGGQQQGLGQAGLDARFGEFARGVDYPLRQAGLLSSAISGLPFEGQTTQRKSTGFGDVLGGLLGLGTAMAVGNVGPFKSGGIWG